jgi:hypothetical protein
MGSYFLVEGQQMQRILRQHNLRQAKRSNDFLRKKEVVTGNASAALP